MSYREDTAGSLMVAQYVGGGTGTGCTGGSNDWTCTEVDERDNVGWNTSIAFDPSGTPWVSYTEGGSTNNLTVAQYVGRASRREGNGGSTGW